MILLVIKFLFSPIIVAFIILTNSTYFLYYRILYTFYSKLNIPLVLDESYRKVLSKSVKMLNILFMFI